MAAKIFVIGSVIQKIPTVTNSVVVCSMLEHTYFHGRRNLRKSAISKRLTHEYPPIMIVSLSTNPPSCSNCIQLVGSGSSLMKSKQIPSSPAS